MAEELDIELFDPEIMPKDYSSDKEIKKKALDHVLNVFQKYSDMRTFQRGNENICIVDEWDKRYRAYKCIYSDHDHSYDGNSKVFTPEVRKAVNIIESEATNALFSREDYFSVDAIGKDPENVDMARKAFGVLQYYSKNEDYVSEYELAIKQALIYDHTCIENVYLKELVEGIYRKADQVPILDEETKEPLINPQTRQPVTRKTYNIYKIKDYRKSIKVEVRDIYRLYLNHLSNNPEEHDIIYRDSKTVQNLLELSEQGVYNKKAVEDMLKNSPSFINYVDKSSNKTGSGKSFIDERGMRSQEDSDTLGYEVLRFQGLFTTKDEKTGKKIKEQFWIDIGERQHVLRVMKNPLIGGWKTFSCTNYDTMPFEFYSDSVLSPYLKLQYALNDKENQSVDGLTYNLNAPIVVSQGAGVKKADLLASKKNPNSVIQINGSNLDVIKKLLIDVPLNHLNSELVRLKNDIDSGTGATSLASGAPTGTQADRSGKAVGMLLTQTRSQFSKFVRKFERNLIQRSLQKTLDFLVQFFDDSIEIEISGDDGKKTIHTQSPAEIVGRFSVRVSTGSQYLKERELRDSMLEFISILRVDDTFLQLVDKPKLLRDIAKTMPNNMEQYIDETNLISNLYGQIQQLQQVVKAQSLQNDHAMSEVERLTGVVKQTDRANEASPSLADSQKEIEKIKNQNQGNR